jgi:hypothetical protein
MRRLRGLSNQADQAAYRTSIATYIDVADFEPVRVLFVPSPTSSAAHAIMEPHFGKAQF